MQRTDSGMRAGLIRTMEFENRQYFEAVASAGKYCFADTSAPFRLRLCDGAVTRDCWHLTRSVVDRPWVRGAAGHNYRALSCVELGRTLLLRLPRRTRPTPWLAYGHHGASSSHRDECGHGNPARQSCGSAKCSRTGQGTSWPRRR